MIKTEMTLVYSVQSCGSRSGFNDFLDLDSVSIQYTGDLYRIGFCVADSLDI
jgi:hypothetical protein